jgi:hypothetical protein
MHGVSWLAFEVSAKDRERLVRRLERLVITEPYLDGAASSLRGRGHLTPRAVRVRSRFVYQDRPVSEDPTDRSLPPRRDRPPATRLLSPRGLALRFYLTALCSAQFRVKPGGRPVNDIPLVAGGGDTGWLDLVAAPVVPMTSGRYSASPASKKQRQVITALQSLSAPDVKLVHLPNIGKASGKYERFQLCDEGGVRIDGDVPDYTVPKANERTFGLPIGLFTNGWIHLLEDTELAFVMMMALVNEHAKHNEFVKIPSGVRLARFGLGRDAYEAHKTLSAFGLLGVEIDENRHHDGMVKNYNEGGKARLHAFRLLTDGFDQPAAPRIKKVLKDVKRYASSIEKGRQRD